MAGIRDSGLKEKIEKEWKPDNEAESELMDKADQAYELFIHSLTAEFRKILLSEE